MVRQILLLSCFTLSYCYAQENQEITLPTDSKGVPIFQQEVKLNNSESSKSIIRKAEIWVNESPSSDNFLSYQYDPDKDTLTALGISRFSLPFSVSNNGKVHSPKIPFELRYILSIKSKSGHYRVVINNLIVKRNVPRDTWTQQLPPKSPTVEQHYEAMRNLPYTENDKRINAELSVKNWNNLLNSVNELMKTLLQSLEKDLRQPAVKN